MIYFAIEQIIMSFIYSIKSDVLCTINLVMSHFVGIHLGDTSGKKENILSLSLRRDPGFKILRSRLQFVHFIRGDFKMFFFEFIVYVQ